MDILNRITGKPQRIGIGLMSGTSLDGMDAALVEISGSCLSTRVELREFLTLNYTEELRTALLEAAEGEGGSRTLCRLNVLLGEIAAEACLGVCGKAGMDPAKVDFVGSHGQTVYHQGKPEPFLGRPVRGTLQIGEAAVIAEKLKCVVVSDFRIRDMAAGGQGAPLVPYTEYLLYRREHETAALQNIGGIGNITILPAGCTPRDIIAFDTGPGNMIIDGVVSAFSGGRAHYDRDGALAAKGRVNEGLFTFMRNRDEAYLSEKPPKSTGRESYNACYMKALMEKAAALRLSAEDTAATVTFYTAWTIGEALRRFCPQPEQLYISGGGAYNPTLFSLIQKLLPGCAVSSGIPGGVPADAKEAAAFAVLANETLFGLANNAPAATGADHPVVMGKISL
ncbi:MAG: anhydro-N-acetylmuramic acid kinase [Treponema sp.]|jgi:anhydro-N-acetylmuramic acid kinase|nr:anhydro-N-acetylmuramic acid kinase [Treponema sp.]